jgi:lipopolysaccharide export system protein LptA
VALASGAWAPAAEAQTRRVEILHADFIEVTSDSAGTVQRLVGGVRLRQDTTLLWADRATIYEARGEAVLDGDVRIVSGADTLTAEAAAYDSNAKVARARGGVRVGDGESVLLAPLTTYDSRAEVSTFEGGGTLLHEGATLTAPRGTYSSARRFAELDGPVRLEDSTGVLTAARGTYDADVRRADFAGDVRLRRPDARLHADSVVYFRRTERARAYGHVALERLGEGETSAERPRAPADSSRRTFLFGSRLLYDGQDETASARGVATDSTAARDPLLLVLRADSTGRVDTTLARAPRLDAARLVAGADTFQTVTAAGGARLWERRLAAVADSVRFVRQPADTSAGSAPLDRLGLFGNTRPTVWADGSQLTGDTLRARARDGTVDSLRVLGTAFAARLDSTLGRLNQIAGGQMLGVFRGDDLRSLSVWPTAQAVYYQATDDGLLNGAIEVSADSLSFRFLAGELRTLDGDRGIQGTQYGPRGVPEDVRLPGFAFETAGAPTRTALLDPGGWEAAWLAEHGPPREWLAPPPAEPGAAPGASTTAAASPETGGGGR